MLFTKPFLPPLEETIVLSLVIIIYFLAVLYSCITFLCTLKEYSLICLFWTLYKWNHTKCILHFLSLNVFVIFFQVVICRYGFLFFLIALRYCNIIWPCHNLFILKMIDVCRVYRLWLLCCFDHNSMYILVHTCTICLYT